jgi:hypothetical protein
MTHDLSAYRDRSQDAAWRKAQALEEYVRRENRRAWSARARRALGVGALCFGAAAAIIWAVLR